jgi:hypothetical protein
MSLTRIKYSSSTIKLHDTSNAAFAVSNYAYSSPSGFVVSSGTTTTNCNLVVNGNFQKIIYNAQGGLIVQGSNSDINALFNL